MGVHGIAQIVATGTADDETGRKAREYVGVIGWGYQRIIRVSAC
jgi:hypothetical protein